MANIDVEWWNEEPLIVKGGSQFGCTVDLEHYIRNKANGVKTQGISQLHYSALKLLEAEIGLHPNMEIGLYITTKYESDPNFGRRLRADIKTIPVINEFITIPKIEYSNPAKSVKKLSFLDRLKVLVKGEI